MSENDRRNVRVLDPRINEPDPGIVDEDHGVSTFAGDIVDERIAVLIRKRSAVPALATVLVEEDEACISCTFDLRV